MTKKTGRPRTGRPPSEHPATYAALDEWLLANADTGIGKVKWAEQNAARYRKSDDALTKAMKRRQQFLNELV